LFIFQQAPLTPVNKKVAHKEKKVNNTPTFL
jgi:hypothetical protein